MLYFGVELAEPVAGVDLSSLDIQLVYQGGNPGFEPLISDTEIASSSAQCPPASITKDIDMHDTFGYIYTSGTTGLAKAAIIKHGKMVTLGAFVAHGCELQAGDRNYCALPLLHTAVGGLGVGLMIYRSVTIIIKRKVRSVPDKKTHTWDHGIGSASGWSVRKSCLCCGLLPLTNS